MIVMAGAGGSWAEVDLASGVALAITENVLSTDFDTVGRVTKVVADATRDNHPVRG